MWQLLCGLHALHAAGVLHAATSSRPTPSSNENCDLKIADYGISRGVPTAPPPLSTAAGGEGAAGAAGAAGGAVDRALQVGGPLRLVDLSHAARAAHGSPSGLFATDSDASPRRRS